MKKSKLLNNIRFPEKWRTCLQFSQIQRSAFDQFRFFGKQSVAGYQKDDDQ